jgi:hypothetical protein
LFKWVRFFWFWVFFSWWSSRLNHNSSKRLGRFALAIYHFFLNIHCFDLLACHFTHISPFDSEHSPNHKPILRVLKKKKHPMMG